MTSKGIRPLPTFNAAESGAPEWELYKRDFQIHLDALGLDDKPGRRKVGVLLSNMGRDCVKIYDAFEWAPAVLADADHGIEARDAEDKYDLVTVFAKFDRHFGVHNYRNIKRQEFLNTRRGNLSIMDYISELKRKAEHCQYGDQKEGLICDMIINGINDKKCSEKLMELPASELKLEKVIQVCRQVELTTSHLKSLESPVVNVVKKSSNVNRNRGAYANIGDRGRKTPTSGRNYPYCSKCCRYHELRNCPAYYKQCDTCGLRGHFKKSNVCRGGQNRGRFQGRRPHRGGYGVHYVKEEGQSGESDLSELFYEHASTHDVFTVESDNQQQDCSWNVIFKVGKIDLNLEIDSGAMCNVLSKSTAEQFKFVKIQPSNVTINGVSGKQIKAYGKIRLPCMYKGTKQNLEFQVLDTPGNINLLGREDAVKLKLIIKDMGLVDCLSRLPLNEIGSKVIDDELMVLRIDTLSCSNHEQIMQATLKDEQFQILKKVISDGWPAAKSEVPPETMSFWDYRDELAVYNGVIYRGERVCIPAEMRAETLKLIHNSHLGFVNCKKRARELVFWPGMNKQIEDMVSRCSACLTQRNKPAKEPMIIQPIPTLPWSKVGTDLFEHEGNHYLVMVDYFSNFIEVAPLQSDTRTSTVLKHMKQNIARYGIMDTLISDNGPQFASREFKDFTAKYGIHHVTSSPLHQQTNGLAERAVQTVKNLIKKCAKSGDDIYMCLLELRNTPRDDETGSPMQRLMGRRAKTLIPISQKLRKPESGNTEKVASKLMDYREKQKFYYDRNAKVKEDLKSGDTVRIQTPSGWKPAEYVRGTEYPRSHVVKAGDSGREYRRNTDMLMKTREDPHRIVANDPVVVPSIPMERYIPRNNRESANHDTGSCENKQREPANDPVLREQVQMQERQSPIRKKPASANITVEPRRSGRSVKKPNYLSEYV